MASSAVDIDNKAARLRRCRCSVDCGISGLPPAAATSTQKKRHAGTREQSRRGEVRRVPAALNNGIAIVIMFSRQRQNTSTGNETGESNARSRAYRIQRHATTRVTIAIHTTTTLS